jgi:hypothetical protein
MRTVQRWAALLGVVAGCYNPSPQEGAPCTSSTQCPTPQRCFLGACLLGEPPPVDASPPEHDAAIDAAPPIDAMRLPCNTVGLDCGVGNPVTTFTCGGNCWVVCTQNVAADIARARCNSWGMGVLGQIDNLTEQTCVDDAQIGNMGTWIGLSQSATATTTGEGWTWNGVTPLSYTNWLGGKPDDGGSENGSEQCAAMRFEDGRWDDQECGEAHDFMCERPM